MSTEKPPMDVSELVTSVATVQSYWFHDLWSPLVTSEKTRGQYSLIEQLMPFAVGPTPHVHEHSDELFYILDGEILVQVDDQVAAARKGQLVRIPAGVSHGFVVTTETARVLNFYAPAEFDMTIATLGTPATSATLPPEGAQHPPTAEQHEALAQRLYELEVNRAATVPDLLDQHRGEPGAGHSQLLGR